MVVKRLSNFILIGLLLILFLTINMESTKKIKWGKKDIWKSEKRNDTDFIVP